MDEDIPEALRDAAKIYTIDELKASATDDMGATEVEGVAARSVKGGENDGD